MKILLITEFVRRFPWSATLWAPHLAGALAARTHEVVCACDGLDDPGLFAGAQLLVRDPCRTLRRFRPLAFQRWARHLETTGGFDATISLSPLVPADLWITNAPTAAALVRTLAGAHQPISAALEIVSRPWLVLAALGEVRARAAHQPRRARPAPRPARLGTLSGDEGVAPLGYASRLVPPDPAARAAMRQRVRSLLGLRGDRPALLLSAVHPGRPGLEPMLRGLSMLRSEGAAPDLLIVGRRAHAMRRIGERAGWAEKMHFLGGTWRVDAAMAAADLAVAPWTDAGPSSTGRFVADALRLACPVLAHPRTPGAELIRPEFFGTPEVGALVRAATPHAWCEAIGTALQAGHLPHAARAARDAGAAMSLDNLGARIERLLNR